jgi:sugar/nucleoside kinase (ribokinase family)
VSPPQPRVAAIGTASWDRLLEVSRYPAIGEQASVQAELSAAGGTTTNTAVALARLGSRVSIAAAIGDDPEGGSIRRTLESGGIDISALRVHPGQRTSLATIVVSHAPLDRTIFWREGAQLARGDRLDIATLYGHDVVVVDVADLPLRRFLLDLPAHTIPRARLLGPLTYLADPDIPDALDLALRHDVLVGSERDLLVATGTWTLSDAMSALQARMSGQTLRAVAVTRGAAGCRLFTANERWQIPAFSVPVVDPTGAGDAFVAGVGYGMALNWDWPRIGRFANAVGALTTRSLGAQASLPTLAEVEALIAR